jgi:ATP-dependent Clp protease ATP-binding subunit ClpA
MFSQKLEMALVTAVRQAKNHRHEFVTVEHLLYGILQDDLINRIIKQCGGSLENLQKRLEKFFDGELPTQKISDANAPVQTLGFNRVLQRAIGHVQSCGKEEVDSGDISARKAWTEYPWLNMFPMVYRKTLKLMPGQARKKRRPRKTSLINLQ